MIIFTLIFSMAVTLFLVNKKMNIGYALVFGSSILALLNGKSIHFTLNVIFITLMEYTTISLALIMIFITSLSQLMNKYKILDRMILSLEKMIGSVKTTLFVAPAILGTLLVTGGALISCPVVETLGDKLNIPKDRQAAINLVFRHGLYFVYPLSPTIILAAQLGGYQIWDLVKLQFPVAVMMYLVGYYVFIRKLEDPQVEKLPRKELAKTVFTFLFFASPIILSLLGVGLFNLPFHVSLIVGILVTVLIHLYDIKKDKKNIDSKKILKDIYTATKPSMGVVMVGIMIFKNVVGQIEGIYDYLNYLLNIGIPLELLIIIASAMISLPMASMQPGIAILFPMILPLAPNPEIKLLYAMLIYTSTFIFYYISPLHVCQILTLDFFGVKINNLYRNYIKILPTIYVSMLIIYYINKLQLT